MAVLFKDNESPVKSSGQGVMLAFMGGGGYTASFAARLKIKKLMLADKESLSAMRFG